MFEWCHSGIEGYCKAAAEMLGDETEKKTAQWLPLCNDIFKDRSDQNITSVWTMSHRGEPGGASNRQTVFEKKWLDGLYVKVYLEEAKRASKRSWECSGLATIPPGSDYEKSLKTCATEEELCRRAASQCEEDAIKACVSHMLEEDENGDFIHDPALPGLVMQDDFPARFYEGVMRVMERGFISERYKPSDVQQFMTTLNDHLNDAVKSFSGVDDNYGGFIDFARVLIAGLVYGPDNAIALDRPGDSTHLYEESSYSPELPGTAIRITQIFDDALRQLGYSEVYHPSQVIFFGRCPRLEQYADELSELMEDNDDLIKSLEGKEQIVFPIALSHLQTSNVHGMLLYEDGAWRFYDLKSTNGTSVESIETSPMGAEETAVRTIDGILELMPGDRIRLGAPESADDTNVFQGATTLLFSSFVDELLNNN